MDLSKIKALTIKFERISNVLACSVSVSFPKSISEENQIITPLTHIAIWDTGASASAITEIMANKLGLKESGMKIVSGLGGSIPKKKYLIDVLLPNGIQMKDLSVTEIDNPQDKNGNKIDNFGMLIGMDIISIGDFSITNFQGKTTMSFRYPSQGEVDYVSEWNRRKAVEDRHKGIRR